MEEKDANKEINTKKHVYKKRAGTYGVTGQLYETKLLSLILFRALKDENVQDFYLGTNLSDIGAFDDICFRFKFKNRNMAVFLQAKHRDDPRKGVITDVDLKSRKSDFSLDKYFDSYLKIKQKYSDNKNEEDTGDIMFNNEFENTEQFFIMYTTACDKVSKKKSYNDNNMYITKVQDLISTRTNKINTFQINYDESDINKLSDFLLDEQLDAIVTALQECVIQSDFEKNALSPKTMDILKKYRLFLIPNVLQITEQSTEELCKAKMNPQFFYSKDIIYINLREKLLKNALSGSPYTKDEAVNNVLSLVFNYTDEHFSNAVDLSKIIGNVIIYDTKLNRIELAATAPQELQKYRQDINNIPISQATFREVYHETGKKKLESETFGLPKVLSRIDVKEDENVMMIFNEQKKLARKFLDNLYFFTKEAKQGEVENILKKELDEYFNNRTLLRVHTEAVFLKLHDKIQKWAMLQGNAYYLTNSCDYIEKSRNEIIDSPFLTILNFNFKNDLRKYNIQFKSEVVENFIYDLSLKVTNDIVITNIVTNFVNLTSIKLMQGLSEENCICINLKFINSLKREDYKQLLTELITAKLDILVVIYSEIDCSSSDIALADLVDQFKKRVYIVTNESLSTVYHKFKYSVHIEKGNNFASLTQETQERLLAYDQVIVQGETFSLGQILRNYEFKDLIMKDNIIDKIIKNIFLTIGKSLKDEKYVSLLNNYLPRYLSRSDTELTFKADNFKVIKSTVVVITAEPGMGKSTLLTHVSMETKRAYPHCWIARINLLDHCSQLFKWQKEKRDIDICDTMTLICKAELKNVEDFELQFTEGVLVLKHCDVQGLDLFNLELIIHSFNNDDIIFIFDGFDEVCPHYKNEAVKLIRTVIPEGYKRKYINTDYMIDDNDYTRINDIDFNDVIWEDTIGMSEQDLFFRDLDATYKDSCLKQVWIASRPYDSIRFTLEYEFGTPFKLKPLSSRDQEVYYQKYFQTNIILNELSPDQFKNIESFYEFMSQYRRNSSNVHKNLEITSIPLNHVYEVAVDHFRNDILYADIDVDKEKLRKEWVSSKELLTIIERCLGSIYKLSDAMKLASIPLHMHVAANYFVNEIKDTETKKDPHKKWDLNSNTFDYYRGFIETKFKSIRLQEKNRRYLDCPDERLFYEKEMKVFIESHKQLAFYAMFHNDKYYLRKLVSRREMSAIKDLIKKIKKGEEKSGLVYRIDKYHNTPMFVHKVLAEYFAVEYVTDKLKLAKNERKYQILDFLINCLLLQDETGLMSIFDNKLKYDDELKNAVSDDKSKKIIFDFLLAQNEMTEWIDYDPDSYLDPYDDIYKKKISSAASKAIGSGLAEVTMFLLNTLDGNLNEGNLKTLVELLKDTFFVAAALINEDKIILYVLDKFRSLDSETVNETLKGSKISKFLSESGAMKSNEDILKLLHAHGRHLTTPYWYFDVDDQNLKYFYCSDSL